MNTLKSSTLSHYTKAVIFLATVISTEMGSNLGLYLAMGIWLELSYIVRIEKGILDYIKRLRS